MNTNVSPPSNFVVGIGASAGGLEAIIDLLSEVPENLNAPIVIAVHSLPISKLTEALKTKSDLRIKTAEDGVELLPGQIYVLPGATHGFFRQGRLFLSEPVRDSGFRPSIDALLMTMAAEYGDRAIAVILSGTMSDGMRGAQVIHDMGGATIVQDPEEARHANMPESVINRDHPVVVAPATELGIWLAKIIGEH